MLVDEVRNILVEVLHLGAQQKPMDAATPLHGAMPELDSMGVVAVITALEEHFGITVTDTEIGAENFATLGTLSEFVARKVAG